MVDQKRRILIAEEDPSLRGILKGWFQKEGWLVDAVRNGFEVYQIVKECNPDIILMDVNLQGRNGIATTSVLRNDLAIGKNIPIILMAASPDKEILLSAIKAGCNDFILKPFKFDVIIKKVEKFVANINEENGIKESVNHKEDEQEAEIITYSRQALKKVFLNAKDGKEIDQAVIQNIVNKMIEILMQEENLPMAFKMKSYNEYTYVHSINVATLCTSFAFHLNWDIRDIQILGEGGFLHDIGKTKIDTNILTKPDKLTDAEYNEIKKHPVLGNEIITKQNYGEEISKVILEHHESVNGTGYPYKLRNEQISKYGKLISIVDSYDAMTTDVCYRRAMDSNDVIQIMSELPDFDTELFNKFKTLVCSEIIGK